MQEQESEFKHLTVSELHQQLMQQAPVIVDIRDQASFNMGHIANAIHLTNESLPDFLRTADFDGPVVVCCYHGNSSQQAAQFLISQDFTDIYSLDGGFTLWQSTYPQEVAC